MDMSKALFTIGIASQLAEIHPQTIRIYEARGLITPFRTPGGTRMYTMEDIDALIEISQMSASGVGIDGIAKILELEKQVKSLEKSMDELECENKQLKAELAEVKSKAVAASSSAPMAIVLRSDMPLMPF